MLLDIRNLQIAYTETVIVDGLSLHIVNNEIISLIGPNGAGKSTVLKAIMNLGDTSVVSGEIFFNGENIRGVKTNQLISRGLSYIPQGNSVFTSLTVEENLRAALSITGNGSNAINTIYDHFPILAAKRKARAANLSGGEKQILGLARALVTKPRLLLLDEPSIGLSPMFVSEIFNNIRALKKDGTSIILVEQRVKEALELSDRVYILKAGRNFFEGTRDEIRKSGHLEQAYLGG